MLITKIDQTTTPTTSVTTTITAAATTTTGIAQSNISQINSFSVISLTLFRKIVKVYSVKSTILFCILESTASSFQKEEGKHCFFETIFDKRYSFEEAMKACREDSACLLFQDYKCDNEGAFKLCNSLNEEKIGTSKKAGTCIYKKPGGN